MIRFLQTPGKVKKIVLGGLLVVICGAMAITLIPGGILGDAFGFGNPQGNIIAKVGDQEVTVNEVQDTARQMGKQQFPRGFPQQFMPFLMQRAAQQLIVQKAMVAEAHRMGFKVTDAELQSELQHGSFASALFPGGTFVGQENYENFIQQNFQHGRAAVRGAAQDRPADPQADAPRSRAASPSPIRNWRSSTSARTPRSSSTMPSSPSKT